MAFTVLVVCTGNICRSPAAELLLRARLAALAAADVVEVSSAGTSGLTGHGMDLPSAVAVRAHGVDPSGHVARRLRPEDVAAADLVLSADTAQRMQILQSEPLAMRRTFTLREFARLGAGLPVLPGEPDADALRERVRLVAGRRGSVEPGRPGADDIGDPFGAGEDTVRAAIDAIDAAVDGVLVGLGLARAGS